MYTMIDKFDDDYFNIGHYYSYALAIFPLTSWILGIITRFQEKCILAGIIRVFFGFNIVWLLDIFFIFKTKKILKLLKI